MKAQILDINGNKTKEITTNLFEEPIREDIIFKIIEATRIWQPYSNDPWAAMYRSASGRIRHKRHSWKVSYGHGMSRVPRKIMWRRGTQFSWVGAIIPSVKGGRRAHPPKNKLNLKKINKKEMKKALLSALTYSSSLEELKKKYASLKNKKIDVKLPFIIDEKILSLKTKDFLESLNKILGDLKDVAIQKKSVRAGRGKSRGRRYKKNAGLLFVIGKNEKKDINGIDVIRTDKLRVSDLAAGGARLTMFTENAIKDLEKSLIENVRKK
ncbi:MAG: 50S ribosomal protein L4 [Candidatus Nanoarchaeia archaeon]|nr:50S ribosomal protein L4 [Candidatus Nanoarchaeia archaeon]MDD5741710.1 50S ribosomal protein L4 [Candidatus Nanoarchaeia archaeon]